MADLRDLSTLRILEIGDTCFFKAQYPERTTLLWGAVRLPPRGVTLDSFSTPATVLRALRDARHGKYDVIVAYPTRYAPWHPRYWLRAPFQTPRHPWASISRQWGVTTLRWAEVRVPLIAIDMDDAFGIGRSAFFLLDKADVFFKRELPVDKWQVLYGTAHPHLPTLRVRQNERWQRRVEKLRPISLPQFVDDHPLRTAPFPEKTHDVFFSGKVDGNSTVRRAGLAELELLKSRGYRIDHVTERLEYFAYLERMSHSWIAWSPEGLGWHCNRHYEAAIAQTVPLMNHPTILRYAPLLDGIHGLYYDPEPGGLERATIAALMDKDRLRRIAIAARDHVFAHHTRTAYCEHILRTAFSAAAQMGA